MKQVEDKTEDEEQEESCEFPGWARDMGPLISFSFSSRWELVTSLYHFINPHTFSECWKDQTFFPIQYILQLYKMFPIS